MKNELAKDRVIETITDIFIDVVGWIERDEILPEKEFVRDMHIADEDLMVFDMEVVKHFGVRLTSNESRQIGTIEDVADLVLELLKDRVIETLIDILVAAVGWIERDEISPDKDFVQDMHIADEDFMVFDMEVIKHFGIKAIFEEGRQARTIERVADLILGHFLQSDASINDLKKLIRTDSEKGPPILPALIEWLVRSIAWFASWAVGLGILFVLMEYADWPLVLAIIPVVLWITFTSWLTFRNR